MLQIDMVVREYLFHLPQELSVMKKARASGWTLKLLMNIDILLGFRHLIISP